MRLTRIIFLFFLTSLSLVPQVTVAQGKPYQEGTVWSVSFIIRSSQECLRIPARSGGRTQQRDERGKEARTRRFGKKFLRATRPAAMIGT